MSESIAILMATYNGARYIREQIMSIQSQTVQDWNLYIRDDGSSDGTIDIIRDFCLSDNRIHLFQDLEIHLGPKASFMKLLASINAEIYLFSDQDDVWNANKIGLTIAPFHQYNDNAVDDVPVLVHTNLSVVDQDLKVLTKTLHKKNISSNLQVLLPANNVTGCTVAINQKLKEIALNPNLKNIVMHDWWLALCAASLGKIYFIQASTMLYRQHGSNQVGTDRNFFDKIKRVFSSKKELNIFNSSIEQAKELLRKHEHHMSAEVRNLIREYIGLLDSSTRQQFSILVKYKFRKNSILGSLWLWMMIMLK